MNTLTILRSDCFCALSGVQFLSIPFARMQWHILIASELDLLGYMGINTSRGTNLSYELARVRWHTSGFREDEQFRILDLQFIVNETMISIRFTGTSRLGSVVGGPFVGSSVGIRRLESLVRGLRWRFSVRKCYFQTTLCMFRLAFRLDVFAEALNAKLFVCGISPCAGNFRLGDFVWPLELSGTQRISTAQGHQKNRKRAQRVVAPQQNANQISWRHVLQTKRLFWTPCIIAMQW